MISRFFCSVLNVGQAARIAARADSLSSSATASSKSMMTLSAPLSSALVTRYARVPGTNKKVLLKPMGVSSGFMCEALLDVRQKRK